MCVIAAYAAVGLCFFGLGYFIVVDDSQFTMTSRLLLLVPLTVFAVVVTTIPCWYIQSDSDKRVFWGQMMFVIGATSLVSIYLIDDWVHNERGTLMKACIPGFIAMFLLIASIQIGMRERDVFFFNCGVVFFITGPALLLWIFTILRVNAYNNDYDVSHFVPSYTPFAVLFFYLISIGLVILCILVNDMNEYLDLNYWSRTTFYFPTPGVGPKVLSDACIPNPQN